MIGEREGDEVMCQNHCVGQSRKGGGTLSDLCSLVESRAPPRLPNRTQRIFTIAGGVGLYPVRIKTLVMKSYQHTKWKANLKA